MTKGLVGFLNPQKQGQGSQSFQGNPFRESQESNARREKTGVRCEATESYHTSAGVTV